MTGIGIILGSTRPNRNGEQVAKQVHDIAVRRDDTEFELVDLRGYPLPHLDEPLPPTMGQYQGEHTKQWADKIASFDGAEHAARSGRRLEHRSGEPAQCAHHHGRLTTTPPRPGAGPVRWHRRWAATMRVLDAALVDEAHGGRVDGCGTVPVSSYL